MFGFKAPGSFIESALCFPMLPHYYLNRVLDSLTMLQKALFIGKIGFIALQILAEIDALGDDYIVAPLNPLRDMMMAVIDFTEKFEESEGVRHMASPGPDPEQEREDMKRIGSAIQTHLQAQWKAICPKSEEHKRLRMYRHMDVLADLLTILANNLVWSNLSLLSVYVIQGLAD